MLVSQFTNSRVFLFQYMSHTHTCCRCVINQKCCFRVLLQLYIEHLYNHAHRFWYFYFCYASVLVNISIMVTLQYRYQCRLSIQKWITRIQNGIILNAKHFKVNRAVYIFRCCPAQCRSYSRHFVDTTKDGCIVGLYSGRTGKYWQAGSSHGLL